MMKRTKALRYQQAVLKALSGKIDNFYLAGGTALSLFYFQHRTSVDLDFFTPRFNPLEIKRVIGLLQKALKVQIRLIGQTLKEKTAKIMVYNIHFNKKEVLKIDFVEDVIGLLKSPRMVDGIRILTLEDIYIRKLYALSGFSKTFGKAGQAKFIGGRSDAKDFYDIYFLSHTFMPLSKFVRKYCKPIIIEGLIKWFQTYDRMKMMDGILELETDKKIDYKKIENHFKKEIDRTIARQVGEI